MGGALRSASAPGRVGGAGPPGSPTLVVLSPRALRRIVYSRGELGLARAYVSGELDIDGDVFQVLALPDALAERPSLTLESGRVRSLLTDLLRAGVFGPPLPPPPEEFRRRRPGTHAPGQGGHQPPLRRRQRLLRARARPVAWSTPAPTGPTPGGTAGGGPAGQARPGLPQARPAARACGCSTSAAAGARWPCTPPRDYGVHARRRHALARAGRLRPQAGRRGGPDDRVEIRVQDYRESPTAPTTRSPRSAWPSTSARERYREYAAEPVRACSARRPAAQPPDRPAPPAATRRRTASTIHRPLRLPGRRTRPARRPRRRCWSEAGFEVRDVEALREHYALTLPPPGSPTWRPHWQDALRVDLPGPGPGLAALHGRRRARLRAEPDRREPDPGDQDGGPRHCHCASTGAATDPGRTIRRAAPRSCRPLASCPGAAASAPSRWACCRPSASGTSRRTCSWARPPGPSTPSSWRPTAVGTRAIDELAAHLDGAPPRRRLPAAGAADGDGDGGRPGLPVQRFTASTRWCAGTWVAPFWRRPRFRCTWSPPTCSRARRGCSPPATLSAVLASSPVPAVLPRCGGRADLVDGGLADNAATRRRSPWARTACTCCPPATRAPCRSRRPGRWQSRCRHSACWCSNDSSATWPGTPTAWTSSSSRHLSPPHLGGRLPARRPAVRPGARLRSCMARQRRRLAAPAGTDPGLHGHPAAAAQDADVTG